jgi:SpoVK/Ycf46/Vps4 family AAA+-type ATPase
MSGADLHEFARRVRRRVVGIDDIGAVHAHEVLREMRREGSVSVDGTATWDTLVVSDGLRIRLRTLVLMLARYEELERQGLSVARALLLWGAPGTGKTQIARTLANEAGLTFLASSTSDLKGAYIGHTAQRVRAAFEQARSRAPAIIFLDEADALLKRRGEGDQFTEEAVNEALQQMDGVAKSPRPVFVVLATNRPDQLDDAIISRVPEPNRIEIPLPGQEERRQIARVLLDGKPIDGNIDDVAARIAAAYTGASGRDIKLRIEDAAVAAVGRAVATGSLERVRITPADLGL